VAELSGERGEAHSGEDSDGDALVLGSSTVDESVGVRMACAQKSTGLDQVAGHLASAVRIWNQQRSPSDLRRLLCAILCLLEG
jgi:hypothetical protein